MPRISANEFKPGLKILINQEPCSIIENEFFKPGKGQAYQRVRFRNLKSDRVLDRTFKSGESVETADVVDVTWQYLYHDGAAWHFIHPKDFTQHEVGQAAMGDHAQWLKGEELCVVTLWNEAPLSVQPPNFVILEVAQTDPGVRGDTATGGSKTAVLETGATVKVPLFIEPGEQIRIDTRSGEYVGRNKE